MDFKQLEYFVGVAEHRSFSRAAVSLGIAQSALSRHVRALEVELRETLLTRTGRGVELTEAGQRLFEHSVAILQQLEQARAEMSSTRDEPVGRITLGLPPSMGRQLTLPLIDGFRRQLPQARLAVVEGLSTHITEWITSGRVDVGLLYNPEPHQGLELQPLLTETLCLVERVAPVPGGPAWPSRAAVPLVDLPRYPLILPERAHVIRRQLENQAALAGLRLDIAWEVSSVAAIIDLVCAGHGHAVLTASAVSSSGRADELVVRPLVEPALNSVLCLATPAHKRSTALMRHASQLLQALVRNLPQAAAAASRPG
ncbi:LysR family transcriptional regulator [Sphaerotilus hippei]|uniref:LysR family transcriptional regulator n=1 Tax=Sphaerotilus hippei TaxID=744406 RepID=A0A318H5F3_9BURK|nr:LysR substrate-binding domain-containing protein [Sphaerotilus hippei]PXW91907.1 LysR family transcriptional regulator [Sphaerotilus hippei]